MTSAAAPREEAFRALFDANQRDLLAYAVRRVESPGDAADIVAETFLVAWRRLDDVPAGEDARLWLYGVARRQLANQRRGQLRRSRLAERLRDELPAAINAVAMPPSDADGVAALRAALERLDPDDRELLMLSAWEELTPRQIARVLGVAPVTLRSRLHRARKRLRTQLRDEIHDQSHVAPTLDLQETP